MNKNLTNQTEELQQVHQYTSSHSLKFSKIYGTTNKTYSTKQDKYLLS
jgi:hypothetical protein